MSVLLGQLRKALPRRLSSASLDAAGLAKQAFDFAQDAHRWLELLGELLDDMQTDISNAGDGSTPGAHASTHLPSGSDPLTTAAAGSIQPDDAAAVGTAESFARSDHKHSIVAATAGAIAAGDSAAEGVATSFARSDHRHSSPSTWAPSGHHTSHESGGSDAIKLDDLAAPDDNTDLNASTSKHGLLKKLSGSSTDVLRGDGTFGTVASTASLGIWFPDAPPTSPSSKDDEFPVDGSPDAKWTSWDSGSALVATYPKVVSGQLVIQTSTHAGHKICGLYQTISDTDFAIYAKVAIRSLAGSFNFWAGIGIGDDISGHPTTSDLYTCSIITRSLSAQNEAVAGQWTDYANLSGAVETVVPGTFMYLRIRVNGTTHYADYSTDGIGWYQIDTRTTATPTSIFVFANNVGTGVDGQGVFEWFRYFAGGGAGSAGLLLNHIGNRL